MNGKTIGFALTGSFCTFQKAFAAMEALKEQGYALVPILSFRASREDTRFGSAAEHLARAEAICGHAPLTSLQTVEPIGPQGLLDALLIAPCTGATLARLAHGMADTPVAMAAKSQLRNGRPVILAVSTNDGLAAGAANLAALLPRRHYYFVPFGQDDPTGKPASLTADFARIPDAVAAALRGEQLQPLLR